MKRKIILASTSPDRKGLLQQIGLEFEVVPSAYQEDMSLRISPRKMVMKFAEGKAEDVANNRVSGATIIGADTIVVCWGRKLGKPQNKEEARKMLKRMSGKTVKVYSGVCIIDTDVNGRKKIVDYEVTKVKMKKLSDEEIQSYVDTGEPMGKSGALDIQGMGAIFIERIEGCYSNIVGFPLNNLYRNLKKLGTDILEYEKWKGKASEEDDSGSKISVRELLKDS